VLERALAELTDYFAGHVRARRDNPGDDLISYLIAIPTASPSRRRMCSAPCGCCW
jgi:cytochrome P450